MINVSYDKYVKLLIDFLVVELVRLQLVNFKVFWEKGFCVIKVVFYFFFIEIENENFIEL